MKADLTTGMSQIPLKQFRIFPNPTTGQVTVDSYKWEIRGIDIYNLNGQKNLLKQSIIYRNANH